MIDIFTVVVPHALMAIAILRLLGRDDLDNDPILPGTRSTLFRRKGKAPQQPEGTPGA